jgi:hypothetical protein
MEQVLLMVLTALSLLFIILFTFIISVIMEIRFPNRFNTSIIMFVLVPFQFLASLIATPFVYFIYPTYSTTSLFVALAFLSIIVTPVLFLVYVYLREIKLES